MRVPKSQEQLHTTLSYEPVSLVRNKTLHHWESEFVATDALSSVPRRTLPLIVRAARNKLTRSLKDALPFPKWAG